MSPVFAQAFDSRVVVRDDGCWEWIGGRSQRGYGRIWSPTDRRSLQAHRVAYEELVGPIAHGLELDPLCRFTSCVNPAHLEPVTHRENVLRGNAPTAIQARKTHCKRGHPLSGANLGFQKYGRLCRTCDVARKAAWKRRRREAVVHVPTIDAASAARGRR